MCFGQKQTATVPTLQTAPVRRPGGPVAKLYARRRREARGVFGNIFSSPLGVPGDPPTKATTLGGGGLAGAPRGGTG